MAYLFSDRKEKIINYYDNLNRLLIDNNLDLLSKEKELIKYRNLKEKLSD